MARIAMLVSNPCNPDFRVIKEAESLARHGHEIRIFCTARAGVPNEETINGVEYVRLPLKASAPPRPRPVAVPRQPPASRLVFRAPSWSPEIARRAGRRALALIRKARRRAGAAAARANRSIKLARKETHRLQARAHASLQGLMHAPFIARRTKFGTMAKAFAPAVAAYRPDIVHAHDLVCLPAGRVAADRCGARLVYDSHELEIHRNPPLPFLLKRRYRAVEARHIRLADAVLTVCEPIADHLAREYGIARPAVIYNAPSVETRAGNGQGTQRRRGWKAEAGEARDIRSEAGVPPGGLLGIYVGLVTINRGIETMIDALQGLPQVWFAAVGPRNEQVARSLIARAVGKGVAERFSILPAVHPDRVVDFISGADFGINPLKPVTLSYDYAMPNKIFEMSLAGLAIVNSDARETARFVREHGIGVIFDHAVPEDCARAVRELTADIARYRPSQDKLESLRARFGWHRQEETLLRLYDRVLEKGVGEAEVSLPRARLAPA